VAFFIDEFIKTPRIGEVYNLGGGKENSCSILEAFEMINSISKKRMKYNYNENNRIGDHICYYSDLRKIKDHYPNWEITKDLQDAQPSSWNIFADKASEKDLAMIANNLALKESELIRLALNSYLRDKGSKPLGYKDTSPINKQ
jgi:dTDP-D-glucose 4,6-dehydratase